MKKIDLLMGQRFEEISKDESQHDPYPKGQSQIDEGKAYGNGTCKNSISRLHHLEGTYENGDGNECAKDIG